MPKIALSDLSLRSLQPPPSGTIDYWDKTLPGFALRISQGGAKTFILKLHNSRRSIGRYPIISLAEARAEAKKQLAEKTLGKSRPHTISYRDAFDQFLEEKKNTRRAATHQNHRLRLTQHFTFSGKLSDVTHQEVARRLDRIKTNAEHDHALSVAKTFFTWCTNRRYISDNPVRGISPYGHTARARVLTDAELQSIGHACEVGESPVRLSRDEAEEPRLPRHFATIVKLLMLTGQRRSEIAALHTSWLNNIQTASQETTSADLWTITLPPKITKNKREHPFPISSTSASILAQCLNSADRSDGPRLLFPAAKRSSEKTRVFSGWSKSKKALDNLSGVTAWTLHDLRRTFATRVAAFTAPHIVERLLNHVSGEISGVAAIYNLHQYQDECRAAVTEWERRLLAIVNNSR